MNPVRIVAGLVLSAALLASGIASADDTSVTVNGPGVITLPVCTIVGRPDRPHVAIEVAKPTPAREAGAAHEAMRRAWLLRSEPAPLRAR